MALSIMFVYLISVVLMACVAYQLWNEVVAVSITVAMSFVSLVMMVLLPAMYTLVIPSILTLVGLLWALWVSRETRTQYVLVSRGEPVVVFADSLWDACYQTRVSFECSLMAQQVDGRVYMFGSVFTVKQFNGLGPQTIADLADDEQAFELYYELNYINS